MRTTALLTALLLTACGDGLTTQDIYNILDDAGTPGLVEFPDAEPVEFFVTEHHYEDGVFTSGDISFTTDHYYKCNGRVIEFVEGPNNTLQLEVLSGISDTYTFVLDFKYVRLGDEVVFFAPGAEVTFYMTDNTLAPLLSPVYRANDGTPVDLSTVLWEVGTEPPCVRYEGTNDE